MKKYLYIITNISMPGICKVGITNNVEDRLQALNRGTAVPTRFQIYEIFNLEDKAQLMEQLILRTFTDQRINMKREFLEIHPEVLCEFVKKNKRKLKAEDGIDTGLFSKLNIKQGEILYFTDANKIYEDIKVKISQGRRVIYKGRSMSMSDAAVKVLNSFFGKSWTAARGTVYWSYNGNTIRELMDKKDL